MARGPKADVRDEVDEMLSCVANAMVVAANAWPKLPDANRRAALSALVDFMLAVGGSKRPPARVLRLIPRGPR